MAGRARRERKRACARIVVAGGCGIFCRLLREHLSGIPRLTFAVQKGQIRDALAEGASGPPDALVCQLCDGTEGAAEVVRAARERGWKTRVVVVVCGREVWRRARATLGSAASVVRAEDGLTGVLTAVGAALPRGEAKRHVLEAAERMRLDEEERGEPRRPGGERVLTERQRQVLKLAARGWTSGRIARELGLSRRTVDTHRSNLLRRLGVSSTAEAVRAAMRRGLIG